ncbi:EamA family transporter [Pseudosulfitobacter sp. SM2401]|uniref:DMT family transporter n=1 Tax=Pseudosulfitobacter sp. SM2401 TaxID=3350098 RepID=UPI0036F32EC0
MERKSQMDSLGAVVLTLFALHLAFNQVVVKVTNGGFEPVFGAGLRSLGAMVVLLAWMKFRGIGWRLPRAAMTGAIISGLLFAIEFMCLFTALDFTSVSRTSIIFYSMPVWLALSAHFLLPGERLSGVRVVGLGLAMGGVVLALLDRSSGQASLLGDALALVAAICWAGIALCVRVTPLANVPPAQQLIWQLIVSAPILLVAAPLFGDLIRDVQLVHIAGMVFQIFAVASFGFLIWFWLMKLYPASSVASFSFLSPVFAVILGWLVLGETIGLQIWVALGLVAFGIFLINRR